MAKHEQIIRWDLHTERWEVWYESSEIAHSLNLQTLIDQYPKALLSNHAKVAKENMDRMVGWDNEKQMGIDKDGNLF